MELYDQKKERTNNYNLFEHSKRKHKAYIVLTNVVPVQLGDSVVLGLNYKSILIMVLKKQWSKC